MLLIAFAGLMRSQDDDSSRPHLKPQDSSDQQKSESRAPANESQPDKTPADQSSAAPDKPLVPLALPKGKKLVLTDGSFQLVREYQRTGDRVRYYSVERSAWEEIPASMVDWAATQKSEAEDQARDKEMAQKIKASELAARTADVNTDRSYEVRPGVILPDSEGLYVLDGKKITAMEQDQAESHASTGREVARIVTGVPLINTKHRIELPGKHAKLRIRSTEPEFYFRPVDGRDPHIFLLRLEVAEGKRSVESVTTNIADISKFKAHEISLLSWEAAPGLTRFTVEQKLEPGEYAITESRPDGEVDLYMWDFGVDASPGE